MKKSKIFNALIMTGIAGVTLSGNKALAADNNAKGPTFMTCIEALTDAHESAAGQEGPYTSISICDKGRVNVVTNYPRSEEIRLDFNDNSWKSIKPGFVSGPYAEKRSDLEKQGTFTKSETVLNAYRNQMLSDATCAEYDKDLDANILKTAKTVCATFAK